MRKTGSEAIKSPTTGPRGRTRSSRSGAFGALSSSTSEAPKLVVVPSLSAAEPEPVADRPESESGLRALRALTKPQAAVTPVAKVSAENELHFGVMLRRARERLGMSAHDVAGKTRISVRWIQALEEARLDALPAPVFISGYLRSYAQSVGLDGAEILKRYHALVEQRSQEASLAEREAQAIGRTSRWRQPLLLLGAAFAVVLALLAAAWRRGMLPTHTNGLH